MQAIILAGGSGLQLRPLTARQPRAMVPLANKPLVGYQIELLAAHGITDVVLCIDHLAERFESHFSEGAVAGVRLRFHRDSEPRGTAGALKAAEDLIGDDEIIVLNGHILTDIDLSALVSFHRKKKAEATVALSPNPDPVRYGIALTDADGRIRQWVEKPGIRDQAPTDTINAGIYVFNRSVLSHIPEGREYSIERLLFPALLAEGLPLFGYVSEAYWQDITTLPDYRTGQEDILCGRLDVHMAGVRKGERIWIGNNATVHPTADISGPVVIGKNTVIERGVKIRGPVSIGAFCRIGNDAVIDRSIIWRGSVIEPKAIIRGCVLGDDCVIKEGAAVQEGSVLGDGAVVASYLASFATAEQVKRRSRIKFGTDGWRGIIADDFTGENVRLVTQAVVDYLREPTTPGEMVVCVGYDNRSQSRYFAREAAKIIAAAGMKPVLSTQSCTSPSLAYMVKYMHAKGGLMVTASHNPPEFNGLKIKAYYGGSASPAIVTRIEAHLQRLIDAGATPESTRDSEATIVERDYQETFLAHLASIVDVGAIKASGLKIVVDPMYGSGAGYLTAILRGAGVEGVIEIRSEANPFFGGINPEPIRENMGALSKAVVENDADIGIALDGDADRVGAVDSQGNFVDCHRIFSVLLRHLVEERGWTGGVVKTVSTSRMIDRLSEKYRLKLYETPIGFKHICDLMLTEDILIGGEESGGIGIKNHIPERDGVLMGLLLLEACAMSGKKLEALIEEIMTDIGRHEYGRIDIHPDPHSMHRIISSLQSYAPTEIAGEEVADISRKDGTKINFTNGSWLLLRPSGTEPVVRVYAEAGCTERVKALLDAGVEVVSSPG